MIYTDYKRDSVTYHNRSIDLTDVRNMELEINRQGRALSIASECISSITNNHYHITAAFALYLKENQKNGSLNSTQIDRIFDLLGCFIQFVECEPEFDLLWHSLNDKINIITRGAFKQFGFLSC